MEFAKLNFFKKFNETQPIGLCSLGLQKKESTKKAKKKIYPKFFKLDAVTPIAI